MSLPEILIAVVWAGLTLYAILGGADFGAGVLHVLAPAGRRGRRRRQAITGAMGPVWEANHVWLVFFLTGLLTLFPARSRRSGRRCSCRARSRCSGSSCAARRSRSPGS